MTSLSQGPFIAAGPLLIAVMGLSAAPGTAQAATHVVTTCSDSGAGSLRAAVAAAAAGDLIDLRMLACSRIVLTSGAITISQSNLSIRGPGYRRFSVSGNYNSSIFRHSGTGRLMLRGITIEQGQHRAADQAEGGCVFSAGHVHVTDVVVRHCRAYAKFNASGGGIYARGNVSLFYSAVYSNGANGAASDAGGLSSGTILPGGTVFGGHVRAHRTRFFKNVAGIGGAIHALDGLTMTYSTVADNRARNLAGGLLILNLNGGPTRIAYSTLSGNSAGNAAGAFGLDAYSNATIENSTISGNTSPWISVGVMHPGMTIANSTIAFNRTYAQFDCMGAIIVSEEAHIESSILAGNTCNDAPAWDISGSGGSESSDIVGADNLIQSAGVTSMPGDTIIGVDPLLGPLADNGGRTLTHMPGSGSAAIDRGNNFLDLEFDQRGEGFPRTKGARTDIGAVER